MGKLEEKILQRFDKKFMFEEVLPSTGNKIKSFLRQELLSYRKKIIKEILEAMPDKKAIIYVGEPYDEQNKQIGFNTAIDEVKSKIKSNQDEK